VRPFLRQLTTEAGDAIRVEESAGSVLLVVRERPVARLSPIDARRLGCWLVLGAHEAVESCS